MAQRRTSLAALALFAALIVVGLVGALGLVALPVLAVLVAFVLAPGGRLPAALGSQPLRAVLAWAVGLLAVAIGALDDENPLRTVCEPGGECSTRAVAQADAFFVAYLASAAALGVWALLGRSRAPYPSDHSSPVG